MSVLFIYLIGVVIGGFIGICFGKRVYSHQEQGVNESFNRSDDSYVSDISDIVLWGLVVVCAVFLTWVVRYGY